MRMDLGLTQTIRQIQTLSPQMYMSMEILCLNSLDLEDRIDSELEENVALEIVEEGRSEEREIPTSEGGALAPPAAETSVGIDEPPDAVPDDFNRRMEQWDRYAQEEYDSRLGPRASFDDDKDEKFEALNNTEGRPMSLQDYLEEQVRLLDRKVLGEDPELIVELCHAIIYNIDERGYLMYSLDEIHQALLREGRGEPAPQDGGEAQAGVELPSQPSAVASGIPGPGADPRAAARGTPAPPPENFSMKPDVGETIRKLSRIPSQEQLQRALSIVQTLDPPGIAGLDLRECLLLQLRRDGQAYPVEIRIIEAYLDDLANNRFPKIAKALGISVEDVKTAAETIASLNPLPGSLFGGEAARFIRPDVVVTEVEGVYEVKVDSESVPRLQISSYYRDLYRNAGKDPELKKFIKKKLENAEWLIAAIRQRQSTLLRIAQEIVEIQKGFLEHGISHLQALKMVDVAERVGVHVSTISRAISGKYVQTPRGIFDLKSFFTGGAVKSDGTLEARGSIIQRIKDLIAQEDQQSPLSDIDIVKRLEESDIRISRRTVTKYREAESIPSSRQRRAY